MTCPSTMRVWVAPERGRLPAGRDFAGQEIERGAVARAEDASTYAVTEGKVGAIMRACALDRVDVVPVPQDGELPARDLNGYDRPSQRRGDRARRDPALAANGLEAVLGRRMRRLHDARIQAATASGRIEAVGS